MPPLDLTGKKFGGWTVLELQAKGDKHNHRKWRCLCSCGKVRVLPQNNLTLSYSTSCRKCRAKRQLLPDGAANLHRIYYQYKIDAKKKEREFSLCLDAFAALTKRNCFYCGVSPSKIFKHPDSRTEYVYNGVDRVDNRAGYTEENCVAACEQCNKAKRCMSVEEFYVWIERVYNKRANGD